MPSRLWYAVIPRSGMEEFRRRIEESGGDASAFDGGTIQGVADEDIQAALDVQDLAERKRQAFQAHVSQNDPSSFFLNTPDDMFKLAFGLEFYTLARGERPDRQLTDLFESI
jgi:N-acetyl-1-D-myo-inositol-2-amino-2-deoxy-alpha-D-glucopyranoside deacetylase